jgi:hypothetical protein
MKQLFKNSKKKNVTAKDACKGKRPLIHQISNFLKENCQISIASFSKV